MNEHDDQQLPDTREVILPEETSAELSPEQAAGKAAALLLAQAIYDRTAQNLVAPLKWIRQLKLDGLDDEKLSELLSAVDQGQACEELKDTVLIKGKKDSYYFDASIMTPEFARVQALIEDKDMLATIAEVARHDSSLYPRPAPFSKFSGYPFRFSADEIEGAAARMQLSEEYRDIGVVEASNGAKAFYSSQSLSKNYARALFQDIEVDSREWQ